MINPLTEKLEACRELLLATENLQLMRRCLEKKENLEADLAMVLFDLAQKRSRGVSRLVSLNRASIT